jgi:hypothetical protein
MREELFETQVEGRIIETRKGLEAMVFEFPFGPFKLGPFSFPPVKVICIANIPEHGQTHAPVYVKMKRGEDEPRQKKPLPRRLPEIVRVGTPVDPR